jgi:ATP-dependent Clp protease adaptor protein ClpS
MSTQIATTEGTTISFDLPSKYKVILLNDNSTPMNFVIDLLIGIFSKSANEAKTITMQVHNDGSGIAGVYSYEIAEQKVYEATALSRVYEYPLSFKIEEE